MVDKSGALQVISGWKRGSLSNRWPGGLLAHRTDIQAAARTNG